jgi:uncharacterized membrane protein YbhN (UPF0104 family)
MTAVIRQIAIFFKRSLRFLIIGGVLFFLVATIRENWQQVLEIRLNLGSWLKLAIATILTLIAHTWAGWVWGWILAQLGHNVASGWGIRVYLKTNIAKYLPGNMWHFYGRIQAAQQQQIPWECAAISILLETLLMVAAGLGMALAYPTENWPYQLILLLAIAIGVHPWGLNRALRLLTRWKLKKTMTARSHRDPLRGTHPVILKHYPLKPILGALRFLIWRGAGFLTVMAALTPIAPQQILPILSAFSWAWLFGIIIPGAPGGIGIFESTAIALLSNSFTPGIVLGSVALYRLINTLAEATGAILAWGYEVLNIPKNPSS